MSGKNSQVARISDLKFKKSAKFTGGANLPVKIQKSYFTCALKICVMLGICSPATSNSAVLICTS